MRSTCSSIIILDMLFKSVADDRHCEVMICGTTIDHVLKYSKKCTILLSRIWMYKPRCKSLNCRPPSLDKCKDDNYFRNATTCQPRTPKSRTRDSKMQDHVHQPKTPPVYFSHLQTIQSSDPKQRMAQTAKSRYWTSKQTAFVCRCHQGSAILTGPLGFLASMYIVYFFS